MSGTGGLESPPEPLPFFGEGEFGTIPDGAPGTGADANDPHIYYVNSFPAVAMEYGIDTFFPEVFGGTPDLAVAGVNVGCKCDRSNSRQLSDIDRS
jgi:5'-nucleotidase